MADRRCPCHSRRRYRRCCQPFHQGRPAPTPEALMRSRYAAYALGLVDCVMHTTHPDGPHSRADRERWAGELRAFCEGTRFRGLRVLEASQDGDAGEVLFRAALSQPPAGPSARDASFTERSEFRRVDGRWLYYRGEPG